MCFESYTWKYEKHDEFNLKLEQSIYNAQRHLKKKRFEQLYHQDAILSKKWVTDRNIHTYSMAFNLHSTFPSGNLQDRL